MPVNDFEKQVQQKMDELQLRPSTEVWEEVEKRIRKEKKRRWFILWFFLLGALMLGGTGWWLITSTQHKTTTEKTITEAVINKEPSNQQTTGKNDINENNNNISKEDNSNDQKVEQDKTVDAQKTPQAIDKTGNGSDTKIPVVIVIDKINTNKKVNNTVLISSPKKNRSVHKSIIPVTKIDNQLRITAKKDENDLDNVKTGITTVETETRNNDTANTAKNNMVVVSNTDKLQTPVAPKEESLIDKPAETIAKIDSSRKKNSNKWEVGITAMAGISAKSDGVSIFGMEKSLDAANLGNVNSGGGQFAVIRPSQPGNGFAWQLGIYAKRKLSARAGIAVGLNFASYSSVQRTGAYVDSTRVYNNNSYSASVNSFYRSGAGSVYDNHYYYIQLPLSFHWQINKGKKIPIIFQNGFSAGLFVGSNALVYNSGANVFYKDNKSFNKLQLSYQSGLYAKLFNRSKNPLTAGFLFNYHLSKQQKENIYGGNHLTSFGIQLGWILKK